MPEEIIKTKTYNKILGRRQRPKAPQTDTYHNTAPRGTDGSHIRPWVYPMEKFATNPECGCTVVYAPNITMDREKPFVLKFRFYLCNKYLHNREKRGDIVKCLMVRKGPSMASALFIYGKRND